MIKSIALGFPVVARKRQDVPMYHNRDICSPYSELVGRSLLRHILILCKRYSDGKGKKNQGQMASSSVKY